MVVLQSSDISIAGKQGGSDLMFPIATVDYKPFPTVNYIENYGEKVQAHVNASPPPIALTQNPNSEVVLPLGLR